jgi:hypothetical protein
MKSLEDLKTILENALVEHGVKTRDMDLLNRVGTLTKGGHRAVTNAIPRVASTVLAEVPDRMARYHPDKNERTNAEMRLKAKTKALAHRMKQIVPDNANYSSSQKILVYSISILCATVIYKMEKEQVGEEGNTTTTRYLDTLLAKMSTLSSFPESTRWSDATLRGADRAVVAWFDAYKEGMQAFCDLLWQLPTHESHKDFLELMRGACGVHAIGEAAKFVFENGEQVMGFYHQYRYVFMMLYKYVTEAPKFLGLIPKIVRRHLLRRGLHPEDEKDEKDKKGPKSLNLARAAVAYKERFPEARMEWDVSSEVLGAKLHDLDNLRESLIWHTVRQHNPPPLFFKHCKPHEYALAMLFKALMPKGFKFLTDFPSPLVELLQQLSSKKFRVQHPAALEVIERSSGPENGWTEDELDAVLAIFRKVRSVPLSESDKAGIKKSVKNVLRIVAGEKVRLQKIHNKGIFNNDKKKEAIGIVCQGYSLVLAHYIFQLIHACSSSSDNNNNNKLKKCGRSKNAVGLIIVALAEEFCSFVAKYPEYQEDMKGFMNGLLDHKRRPATYFGLTTL